MLYQDDKLTGRIVQSIIRVHQALGPGFLESVYRKAMLVDMKNRNISVETEKEVLIFYEGERVGWHRLDLFVEDEVIVELKTVEDLSKAHYAQVRSYLKATGKKLAILVNSAKSKADFRRVETV